MSNNAQEAGVFSILPEEHRQQFRLLELPPDLLAILLTSSDPQSLLFKSASESIPGTPSETEAVICTPDATYNIRQVNTSNSLYICQPSAAAASQERNGREREPPGLQAIAQNDFTLQLSRAGPTSAAPYLKALLPTYASTGSYQTKDLLTKQQLFDNIPLSEAECAISWQDLACFESPEPKSCFLPSPSARAQAWKSILDLAVANRADMTAPLSPQQVILILDPNEEWPVELGRAVLGSVSNMDGDDVVVNADKCVVTIGLLQLAVARKLRRTLGLRVFLAEWKDALPEAWRAQAEMSKLPRTEYVISEGRQIKAAEPIDAEAAATKADTKKRKWHDKFRASKKTA
ncbi:hypothetical protein LTR62_001324 [Meristemomyces frigidus]|uniref:Sister chromatid cohesion protein DCC1 n=1 Tax=Meristemomyces frigidus TaxID=1508187 RepID=A0AAN7YBS5_9PEZI|nr:hypothetical protein LTR62_001324 [Meristemomyces frigidus]